MNGEISQASRIVAAARKAMKDGGEYSFTPLGYEESTAFNFCDRNKSGAPLFRANDPADWFAHLKSEGVVNIFMILGMKNDYRTLGFSNSSGTSIFVRYGDNTVTRFAPVWKMNPETTRWNIEYTEHIAENAPASDPAFRNESSLMEAALKDITELAKQLGETGFERTFHKAYEILTGGIEPKLKSGAVVPSIPEDRMKGYLAADVSDVFGAMGSWNDAPAVIARDKGLEKDYLTLSERLMCAGRLMVMYAVNFPISE